MHIVFEMSEDLVVRPWGLRDFRVVDPSGYYLRITERHPGTARCLTKS